MRHLGRQRRQTISSPFGPTVIDSDTAMLDIAGLAQAAPERREEMREPAGRFQAEEPDHRHGRLLRPRPDRPRSRRSAAEQGYQLAPSYVGHGLPLGTRCASLPHAQVAGEATGRSLGKT
jgi:hypothetical protein